MFHNKIHSIKFLLAVLIIIAILSAVNIALKYNSDCSNYYSLKNCGYNAKKIVCHTKIFCFALLSKTYIRVEKSELRW